MNSSVSKTAEFSMSLRVYIEDTDAGGIVFYVNYLKFMERARTELMRSLGFGKQFIFNRDLMFVVQNVSLKYLQAAYLDEELRVTANVKDYGAAYVLLEQSVIRDGAILVHGDIKIVCVDKQSMKPRRMPREIIDAMRVGV
jgi:tol-pal system-associated acyl-CoA thioesterase